MPCATDYSQLVRAFQGRCDHPIDTPDLEARNYIPVTQAPICLAF